MIKAVLTGYNRGLGLGIATTLLGRGYPVLGLARKQNEALQRQFPTLLQEIQLDLSIPGTCETPQVLEALYGFAAEASCILLINNAGMVAPVGPLSAQLPATINQSVQLNIAAPFILSALLARQLAPSQELRILHVSSGAGRSAYPGWAVYCATKAALDMHAEAVALDRLPGVRICSLAPGVIDTDMQAEIRQVDETLFPNKPRFQQLKAEGQLTSPNEAGAQLVEFMLGPHFGKTTVADLRQNGQ
jgi:benzil reductase ((S)-benzoin forming)